MMNTYENVNNRSASALAASIASGVLLLGAFCTLVCVLMARNTAARQLNVDTQIENGLVELARTECQQFGHSQEILALYDRMDPESRQRRERAANHIDVLGRHIDDRSSHVAHTAQSISSEHESYDLLVEELMLAGGDNQKFIDDIHTLERLGKEGRTAEAEQFAQELRASCDQLNTRMLDLLDRFHASVLDRIAEHHRRESAGSWWLLGAMVAAIALWVFYYMHRWRQTQIELARSRAVKSPRAEHLNVMRAQTGRGDDGNAITAREKPLAGCRVMAAEDGPHNQQFIKRVLAKAGAEVVIAANGDDATKLVFAANKANEPFDVVLMDMQMPVMDGFEAAKTLRRFQYQGPLVAISAQNQSGDRERCLDAGCDAYLAKPINRAELIAVVAECFAGRSTDTVEHAAID